MKVRKLIIISAPSGAGKTTLCKRLLSDLGNSVKLSISCTTRKPRGSEKNGVDYFFLTPEAFNNKRKQKEFAEWAEVHGAFYGTSRDFLETEMKNGFSILLDIDVQGAASLRDVYPEQCLTVFISPPNLEILEKRLRKRGTDTEETILKRLERAQNEMNEAPHFNKIILNDDLERAYSELKTLVYEALHGR